MISVICEQNNGDEVVFDVVDTEADDHDETYLVFELFNETVGS